MTYRYEKAFEGFYGKDWRHDTAASLDTLLLNGYPYSVSIDLPKDASWIDLGVGTGRVLHYHLGRRGLGKWSGVDIHEQAIGHARGFLPEEVRLWRGDVRDIVLEKHSYDLITMFGTLQAFPKSEWIPTVSRLCEFLRPGGKIGFSFHPVSSWEILKCLSNPGQSMHMTAPGFVESELKRCGFDRCYRMERQPDYALAKRISALFGIPTTYWHGFRELYNDDRAKKLCHFFKIVLPALSMGVYWVWVYPTRSGKSC